MSDFESKQESTPTTATTSTTSVEENNENEPSQLNRNSAERLQSVLSEKTDNLASFPSQESNIGLEWLELNASHSTVSTNAKKQNEKNLRIKLYEPPKSLQVIIEESKVGLVTPTIHQVEIEESKVECLCDLAQKAVVESNTVEIGVVTKNMWPPTSLSDDDGDQSNKDTHYESFEENNDAQNSSSLLPTVYSCCSQCERETQTPKVKSSKRMRLILNGGSDELNKSTNVNGVPGTSSDCASCEQPRKLVIKAQSQNTFRQRQLDLHRHKILVEQRRLELLELKIARERDEMLRDAILYEKELELKTKQLNKIKDDRVDDNL